MTVIPDPPAINDSDAVALWLAVFDRWFAGFERRLLRDELDGMRRWAAERDAKAVVS